MGTRVNTIEGEPSPIVAAIDTLCCIIPERVLSVFKRFDIFFQYTSMYRRQKQALTTMRIEFAKVRISLEWMEYLKNSLYSQIIEDRRRLLKTSRYQASQRDDDNLDASRPKMAFLDTLLTAEVEGKPLTFEEIFEEVSTFMFEVESVRTELGLGDLIYVSSLGP